MTVTAYENVKMTFDGQEVDAWHVGVDFAIDRDQTALSVRPVATAPRNYEYSVEMAVPRQAWKRILRQMTPVRCRKCDGEKTRGHHRKCVKRGNRQQALEAVRRWTVDAILDAPKIQWRKSPSRMARLMMSRGASSAMALRSAYRSVEDQARDILSRLNPATANADQLAELAAVLGVEAS